MSKLLRYYSPGSTYFVTSVTRARSPILGEGAQFLYDSITESKAILNFEITAWVIIPDHFHIINPLQNNLSNIMKRIKLIFSYKYRHLHKSYRGSLWQPRFWDHIIRDQDDMNKHIHT